MLARPPPGVRARLALARLSLSSASARGVLPQVEKLLDKLVRVKISDKDIVYEEGETAENMFIIESGMYE
eukprot:990223-Pyramimonas_sp.AAC.3